MCDHKRIELSTPKDGRVFSRCLTCGLDLGPVKFPLYSDVEDAIKRKKLHVKTEKPKQTIWPTSRIIYETGGYHVGLTRSQLK